MLLSSAYAFLRYLREVKQASEHTLRNYTVDLNALAQFLWKSWNPHSKADLLPKIHYKQSAPGQIEEADKKLPLERITKQDLRHFLAEMAEQRASNATIVRRTSGLRAFFRFCVSEAWISQSPTEGLQTPKREKRLPYALTFEEIKQLFDQPDTSSYLGFRDRTILELFYSSALRVSELVALDREDFDENTNTIRVKGKGQKERIVPTTPNAACWIKAYLEHKERHQSIDGHAAEVDQKAIFLNKFGRRLSPRSVDRSFERYLKSSGLAGKVTPHTIRHTIATHWLEKGMDLPTIQELLGHKSATATAIYTKVSPKLKKEVHEKAHPRA